MKTQLEKNGSASEKELFVKMVVDAWETQNSRVNKLLEDISDERLQVEIAPGRNSGVYLLGHLTAVSDGLLPILGFGERLHPRLENIFLKNSEKLGLAKPSLDELKQYWKDVVAELSNHISKMAADDWFAEHTAVSDEDFAKEPHRNRLNVLMNRTTHQSYHLGQLALLPLTSD
jgi:uncharacterized damage-inducible protein DinB